TGEVLGMPKLKAGARRNGQPLLLWVKEGGRANRGGAARALDDSERDQLEVTVGHGRGVLNEHHVRTQSLESRLRKLLGRLGRGRDLPLDALRYPEIAEAAPEAAEVLRGGLGLAGGEFLHATAAERVARYVSPERAPERQQAQLSHAIGFIR